jgi:hypothetical protein
MGKLLSVQGDAMAVATRDRAVPLREKAAVRRVVGGIFLGPWEVVGILVVDRF